jgi:hypothetical protein
MRPRSMSPGLKSTKTYGPVPTGLRFAGASRDLAPLKSAKRCFGMMQPLPATKESAQKGVGFEKVMRTVCESILSTVRSR